MSTPGSHIDPEVKSRILRGVLAQNREMQVAGSTRRPSQPPGAGAAARERRADSRPPWFLALAWLLIFVVAAIPGNTPRLTFVTSGGAEVGLPGMVMERTGEALGPLTMGSGPIVLTDPAAASPAYIGLLAALGYHGGHHDTAAVTLDPTGRYAGAGMVEAARALARRDAGLSAAAAAPEPVELVGALTATGERRRFSISSLFGLKVQTIVIDPGHGGADLGAVGPNGLREKDLALDLALRLRQRFGVRPEYRILLTREHDIKMSLKERVAFANREQADLFVSLHLNTLPQREVNLIETYYFGPHTNHHALAIAEKENQGSDYGIGEFSELLHTLGTAMRTEESRELAHSLQRSLVAGLGDTTPTPQDAGVKTAPFVVLLGVEAPSVLAEISCLSNPREAERLATEAHRERIAAALEAGILHYLNHQPTDRLMAEGE